jgi:hypothetical protein
MSFPTKVSGMHLCVSVSECDPSELPLGSREAATLLQGSDRSPGTFHIPITKSRGVDGEGSTPKAGIISLARARTTSCSIPWRHYQVGAKNFSIFFWFTDPSATEEGRLMLARDRCLEVMINAFNYAWE